MAKLRPIADRVEESTRPVEFAPGEKATTPVQGRVWFAVLLGSTVGGFIPDLWGAGLLSYSALILSAVGGLVGLWLVYKMY